HRQTDSDSLLRPSFIIKMTDGAGYHIMAPIGPVDPIAKRKAIIDHVEERQLSLPIFEEVFFPAISPIQAHLNQQQAVDECVEYSSSSARKISIIIPLYRNFDFIRNQLFAFYADSFIREQCEIVYVNDDPAYGPGLKSLIEGYWADSTGRRNTFDHI
ncbi:hypothetical protein, partial [Shinella sp.]|uniref:hypothetical protein n=1 Tax=Shinella sp. TaxID=1870904 RepID=UPI003F72448D